MADCRIVNIAGPFDRTPSRKRDTNRRIATDFSHIVWPVQLVWWCSANQCSVVYLTTPLSVRLVRSV